MAPRPHQHLRPDRRTLLDWNRRVAFDSWDERKAAKAPAKSFRSLICDGEELTASTNIDEMEWRFGTGWSNGGCPGSVRNKIRRSLDIRFSAKPANAKVVKGGTLGHGIDMLPGEMHEAAFRRYCQEHRMVFQGELRRPQSMMTDKEVEEIIARVGWTVIQRDVSDDAQLISPPSLADRKASKTGVTRLRETLHGDSEHLNGELHDGRADHAPHAKPATRSGQHLAGDTVWLGGEGSLTTRRRERLGVWRGTAPCRSVARPSRDCRSSSQPGTVAPVAGGPMRKRRRMDVGYGATGLMAPGTGTTPQSGANIFWEDDEGNVYAYL